MPHTIDDIVDFAMNKDHLNLKAAVDEIMSSRVDDALEMRKEYVGKTMFNPVQDDVPEEVDTDE